VCGSECCPNDKVCCVVDSIGTRVCVDPKTNPNYCGCNARYWWESKKCTGQTSCVNGVCK
jgi:hypothetical protein